MFSSRPAAPCLGRGSSAEAAEATEAAAAPPLVQQFDERNVRRRVYDALNVLMAVGVISKDKLARKIVWKGLANKGQDEAEMLEVRPLAVVPSLLMVARVRERARPAAIRALR